MMKPLRSIKILKQESGAALMMAIFSVTLLMIIATEIMYETNVELQVSSQSMNQVKAHYAAKAGVEISLLRIHIYKKVMSALPQQTPAEMKQMLDMIWTMPFAWPPVVPGEASSVDKDEIQASVKESNMQGTYFATIESESSKLDINDLANKAMQPIVKAQLLQIFKNRIDTDEEFQRKYGNYDFEGMINNMTDWVDEDRQSSTSGDESSLYSELNQPDLYPPNKPFKTIEELHMVAGMTDEFYAMLAPRITVYGAKGINVNYATKDILSSLPGVTPEIADKILERREDKNQGPFDKPETFVKFIQDLGVQDVSMYKVSGNEQNPPPPGNDQKPKVHILTESEFNFRVRSKGSSGKVSREITAIVYDLEKLKERVAAVATPINGQTPTPTPANPTPSPSPSPTNGGSTNGKPDRPNIVYWNEV